MDIQNAIGSLESAILNASKGLPDDVFLFVSRITPMVNVDLLIKNEQRQTLLTWRDDGLGPPGWHLPGGIIRYKETMAHRIQEVARTELGAEVEFNLEPLAVNQFIHETRKNRGHFISLLFSCKLLTSLDERLRCDVGKAARDQWRWHSSCPIDIIPTHEVMYKKFL